jgi:cation:H+ antiporter
MFASLSLPVLLLVFAAGAAVILLAGLRMTRLADQIADRTGLGEAVVGGALLGGATSLSGITVSVTAAASGDPSLAFSNAVGGIAAQTAFLALGDLAYRKINLEHAAAEPANLFQATLLAMMMSLAALAVFGPDLSILGVHPASILLAAGYGVGLVTTARVRERPMWRAVETSETRADEPESEAERQASPLVPLLAFVALMLCLGLAGWVLAQVAGELIPRLGLKASLVGALMTAVATSLPELVTTLAAIRRGALQLAVGGVIGGNVFDTLFLTFADVGYREGSIYHAIGPDDTFWLVVGILMSTILLGGMIVRQSRGPAGIGWESALMLAVYAWAIGAQTLL